jgi:hypothetical protein
MSDKYTYHKIENAEELIKSIKQFETNGELLFRETDNGMEKINFSYWTIKDARALFDNNIWVRKPKYKQIESFKECIKKLINDNLYLKSHDCQFSKSIFVRRNKNRLSFSEIKDIIGLLERGLYYYRVNE